MSKGKIKEIFVVGKARFKDAELTSSAVLIAYYMLLSIFPLAIAAGNLLPLFNISPNDVLPYVYTIVPDSVQPILGPIIENLLTQPSGGLLVVSVLVLLWSASKGVSYIERGINKAYGLGDAQSGIIRRIVAVLILIAIFSLGIGAILVLGLGSIFLEQVDQFIPISESVINTLAVLRWPITIIAIFAILTLIFMLMPNVKVRFRDAWPGALLAMVGWLILVEGFSIYLHFTNMSMYGVLGTFLILIFWLNFASIIVLAGAVLNATVYTEKYGQATPRQSVVWDKFTDFTHNLIFKNKGDKGTI